MRIATLSLGDGVAIVVRRGDRMDALISADRVAACFSPRESDSHKGTYGNLLTVCGSYGMAGAALLCARAALRSGVGLLTAAIPQSVYPLMAGVLPEAVYMPLPQTADGRLSTEALPTLVPRVLRADAVVMGCGLGTGEDVRAVVTEVLRQHTCPLVLDADGINVITAHTLVEETGAAPRILTPHPLEFARLSGIPIEEVQSDRVGVARRFADTYGVILVLKGHHTVVAAPDRAPLINPTGNAGMATGGSGDVLAGIIGSLAAQGMDAYDAAVCGVYLHGAAGDAAAQRLSQHAMLPSDMINELCHLFLKLE